MPKNFISVSGITQRVQLMGLSLICQQERLPFDIAVGFLTSHKSMNEKSHNPRQVEFDDLARFDMETKAYRFMSSLHYFTRDNDTIVEDLGKIIASGATPSLVQFNTLPPTVKTLQEVKDMGFQIIFKVPVADKNAEKGGYSVWKGDNAQDATHGNIDSLVDLVHERKDVIDYVMFDPSHGTNIELGLGEGDMAIRFGMRICSHTDLDHLGLVYAGGINPGNVKNVTRSLFRFFSNRFSIDSESGIRTDDVLDSTLVRSYLTGYRDSYGKVGME